MKAEPATSLDADLQPLSHVRRSSGPGPVPVPVPVPGTSGSSADWAGVADLLADRFTVPVPDLPDDAFVAPVHSIELSEHVPGARTATLRAGHAASVEDPEGLTRELLEFLPARGSAQ